MTNEDFSARVRDLIKEVGVGMLTTTAADGKPVSRPLSVQQAEDDADLWFFTSEDSNKIAQLRSNPMVNVAFSKGHGGPWVSVSGKAAVVHDRAKAEELWSPMLKAWFPEGLETDGLVLIRVHSESAEYWDSAGSRLSTVIGLAKAIATGESAADKVGENESGKLAE